MMINIPKEIRALLKNGGVLKNIRIHFPNGERKDITNANVVQESFSFTESLCSQSQLQFGLCEASVVQFDVYGIENIKGYAIEVFHEIDISSLSEEFIAEYGMTSDDVAFPFYRIPYGKFTVDECMRQSDMKRRRVVAYGEMLVNLKPNEFELLKGDIQFIEKGNYEIDLIKYLYSNVSANSVIPNSTIENASRKSRNTMPLGDYALHIECVASDFRPANELVKVTFGKKLKTLDEALSEIVDYAQLNFPNEERLLSDLIYFRENTYVISDNLDYVRLYGSSSPSKVNNSIIKYFGEDEKDRYFYFGVPYMRDDISITTAIWLGDADANETFINVNIREEDVVKIESVTIDAPKLTVSYPLKKGKDKFYYIKDIPYESMGEQIEAALELCGKFGKIDRCGNFDAVSICQRKILYPSNNVFPGKNVHPNVENAECIYENEYMSAWYADEYTKPYDKVCVTYTNTDGEEEYMSHMLVDTEAESYNKDDYQTYSLTDNYLIQNGKFSSEDMEQILLTVGEAIKDVKYMPSDVDLSGRPDLEAGDSVQVSTPEGTFETVILRRTLTGIQCLTDNFESKG